MWRYGIIALCWVGWPTLSFAGQVDYTGLGLALGRLVDENGRVDYGAAKGDTGLAAFVAQVSKISPDTSPELFPTQADSLAFWINTYNALVISGVSLVFPIGSVTEIAPDFGFFKTQTFVVGGKDLTLDEIEHQIIRKQFDEPRIHAALNCAAVSCPRLQNTVFIAESLENQLDTVMRNMVQNKSHVAIDRSARVVTLSAIFDWFSSDFKRGELTLVDYILPYLSEADRLFLTQDSDVNVLFFDYNWALNSQ